MYFSFPPVPCTVERTLERLIQRSPKLKRNISAMCLRGYRLRKSFQASYIRSTKARNDHCRQPLMPEGHCTAGRVPFNKAQV